MDEIKLACCICGIKDNIEIWETQLWCPECKNKEVDAQQGIADTVDERVAQLAKQVEIDTSIKTTKDFFNAKTTSMIRIRELIDEDDTITTEDKNFEEAKRILDRLKRFSKVLFQLKQKELEVAKETRVMQSHLNDLANKIRTDQREQLRLKDITYKPVSPKISKPRKIKKPKFNKKELREVATSLQMPEYDIQTICVQKNFTPLEAKTYLQSMIPDKSDEATG